MRQCPQCKAEVVEINELAWEGGICELKSLHGLVFDKDGSACPAGEALREIIKANPEAVTDMLKG